MAVVSEVQVPNGRQHSLYTRSEVAQHKRKGDAWIIIHGKVYNVTNWLARHPGGAKVLLHYAGQDATVRENGRGSLDCSNHCYCRWRSNLSITTKNL